MRALVISGGGSKGAFAVGALKYLMLEKGLDFDILAGTSTGALIAPMIAAQGKAALAALETEYTTVTTKDILDGELAIRVLEGKPSFHGSKPLRKRIEAHVTQQVFDALRASKKRMAVTSVDLHDGKLVYYQTGPTPIPSDDVVVQVQTLEQLVNAIHASASIPVYMPPVPNSRPGAPADPYVDGGVREYVPIEIAIDAGADEICCIILAPQLEKRATFEKPKPNVVDVLQRSIDLLSEEVGASDVKLSQLYTSANVWINAVVGKLRAAGVKDDVIVPAFQNAGVKNPFAGKRAVSLRIIRPQKPLRGETLKFSPDDMKANLEYGFQCAKEQWDASGK
ncbi:patatin-like phospholipase family protein [Longimicrobium sp.]|uniref:patatin-like phospholipase family protein n=1 Tax=Longimicrobium sp. TaxID=2029185 RepID=UPI002C43ED63|nr:patatin-like phospholipase family protein [Longimicrobium sp.]HSU17139.1 patatin-like phospholipase family protein [Longimicrobium sp.]